MAVKSSPAPAKASAPRTPSAHARVAAATAAVREASGERAEPFYSLNPCVNEVVPPAALQNLANYKYNSVDNSILQKYLPIQRFWNWVVTFVPYWMAPNMLTLLACACSMSYPLCIMWFDYKGWPVPPWLWVACAGALLCYQTLDSIDGKHARRTRATGALGELFDHGCDALFTPFMIYVSARVLAMTGSQTFVFTLLGNFGLFATIFEQFITGVFILGPVNGPTEGIFISAGVMLATAALGGSSFWETALASPWVATLPKAFVAACKCVNLPADIVVATHYRDVAFAGFVLVMSIEVIGLCRSAFAKLGNRRDVIETFALNAGVLCVWALFGVLHPKAAYAHAGKYCIVHGIYFAYTASSLTVRRLCQLPACHSVVMTALCVAIPVAKLVRGDACCVGCCVAPLAALMTLSYVFWLVSVFHQIARALGCNVVTLTEAQVKVSAAEAEKRLKAGEM